MEAARELLNTHWYSLAPLVFAVAAFAAVVAWGDGSPTYKEYPFVGSGLLKPWLTWSRADRWRLHELEFVGYRKFSKQGEPWNVTFWGLRFLILPPTYLRDLRTTDRRALNFARALSDALNMEASVGDAPTANTIEIDVISKQLNARLHETISLLSDEADYVFSNELGHIECWKSYGALNLSSTLVHHISNRILVGPDLCRRHDYRATVESLNMSHILFGALLNFFPLGPFRKGLYWLLNTPYRFYLRKSVYKYIVPVIQDRLSNEEAIPKRPFDVIQLMLDMIPPGASEAPYQHAIRILHLHFASTGSNISLLHNCLWLLLKNPEYIEPMRQEIEDVLAKFGPWDSKHTLSHLHLLDSFLRESLRVHPPSALVCLRLAQEPVTLHDGLHLKAGTRVAFPAQSVHFDPCNYENPNNFVPFRFAGSGPCRCSPGGASNHSGELRLKADAPDERYLAFGFGKQACPGRFFAIKVLKIVLGRLILEYDFKAAETLPSSPTSGSMEGFFLPTNKIKVLIKSRKSS